STAGKYLSEVISVKLVDNPGYFQVVDRQHLAQILKEHKLNSEGYIDEATAKQLGKIIAVDAIVTGTITVLSDKIMITLKVLDTETALVVAASLSDLPLDADACALLGINCGGNNNGNSVSATKANNTIGSRGFNSAVQSEENYNNPETVSKECETKDVGDFCFSYNEGNQHPQIEINLEINFSCWGCSQPPRMILNKGQTQCYYSLKAGIYNYTIREYNPGLNFGNVLSSGQINVERCKSKTFTY
ncbi:MAG TPA: FlgO family outer membrane protein, partial [Chitinophagales bacterium]|nr:FlgO family outer membrane protein [Chitinophagales bacterium]